MGKKEDLRIGIYCRVSSESQSENTSINKQRELGVRFCENEGYEYEVFSEVISGKVIGSERDEFKRLEDKLYSGELNGIWIYDWDRMIRELGVGVLFRDLIESVGCKLFVGNSEKDLSSDSGSLEFGIGSVFSDYWRRKISREMKGGMRKRLENDEVFMGVVGVGYKRNGKRIEVDGDSKELVEDCYKMYLHKNVKTYRDLIRRLKSKYKEGLDKRINEKSVSRILKDEKYKGIYNLNWDGGNYKLNIGRIISDELFDEVGKKIEFNKGLRKGNTKNKYLLKGYVKCDNCGDNMWMRGGGNDRGVYYYYECSRNKKNNRNNFDDRFSGDVVEKCSCISKNTISVKKLEEIVWCSLFEILSDSDSLKEEYFKKYRSKDLNEIESKNEFKGKLKYYEGELKKWEELKNKNITYLLGNTISEEDYKNWIKNEYDKNLREIKKKYNEVKKEFERIELKDDILEYIERFEVDLNKKFEYKRFEDKRRFIEKFINEVRVRFVGLDIDGKKEYELKIRVNLYDEYKENDEEVIDNIEYINGGSKFNVYKSNLKSLAFWRLQTLYLVKINGPYFGNPLTKRRY